MKKYYYLLVVMLMALVSVSFSSCGDDEPKGSSIVGTWNYFEDNGDVTLLQFTKGGQFNEVDLVADEGVVDIYVYRGKYTVSGDKLTITYVYANESETVDCTFRVNEEELMISSNGTTKTLLRVDDSVIEEYLRH